MESSLLTPQQRAKQRIACLQKDLRDAQEKINRLEERISLLDQRLFLVLKGEEEEQ